MVATKQPRTMLRSYLSAKPSPLVVSLDVCLYNASRKGAQQRLSVLFNRHWDYPLLSTSQVLTRKPLSKGCKPVHTHTHVHSFVLGQLGASVCDSGLLIPWHKLPTARTTRSDTPVVGQLTVIWVRAMAQRTPRDRKKPETYTAEPASAPSTTSSEGARSTQTH